MCILQETNFFIFSRTQDVLRNVPCAVLNVDFRLRVLSLYVEFIVKDHSLGTDLPKVYICQYIFYIHY